MKLTFRILSVLLIVTSTCLNAEEKEFSLEVGDTWVYDNIVYQWGDTMSVNSDTLCVLGKYKDFFKYSYGFSHIDLVNYTGGMLLSYGFIQLADTIYGYIQHGDSLFNGEPTILESDTIMFDNPIILAIFKADEGSFKIDTSSQIFRFPDGKTDFFVFQEDGYRYKNDQYNVNVVRFNSSCPAVSCRYTYYSYFGKIYEKSMSRNGERIVQEMFLNKFMKNYTMKKLKISENARYF